MLVSYLSVIVNICGVLILFFSAFLERFQSRKRLTLGLTVISRLLTVFLVLIPVLVPAGLRLAVFIPVVIAAFTLQAQTIVVLNQWMLGFMDEKRSGRYISMRQTLTLMVTVALSVTGGWWMDLAQGGYTGFALLFTAAAFMGVCEVIALARTPEGEPCQTSGRGCKLRDFVKLPFGSRRFLGFVLYILTFYLLLYVSDSFTMVYMMKYLALPYRVVTGLYLLISLPQLVLLGIWGKISDRKGHEFVLKTSIWLFAGETFFMTFASSRSWFVFIPAAFLISSAANAGFVISVFNRRYELMPEENRIVYDNFYTAAIGLGFIAGPVIGGALKGWLEAGASELMEFAGIRLLYPVSTVGILLLQAVYMVLQRKRKEKREDAKDRFTYPYGCEQ